MVYILYVELGIVIAIVQGVSYFIGVFVIVRQRGFDDDEQLVVGRMEVSFGQFQVLVVFFLGQQRFGAIFGYIF